MLILSLIVVTVLLITYSILINKQIVLSDKDKLILDATMLVRLLLEDKSISQRKTEPFMSRVRWDAGTELLSNLNIIKLESKNFVLTGTEPAKQLFFYLDNLKQDDTYVANFWFFFLLPFILNVILIYPILLLIPFFGVIIKIVGQRKDDQIRAFFQTA